MKHLSKEFTARVIRERIVDTRTYRYIVKECNDGAHQWAEIRRLPLASLDTVAALDAWETVQVLSR